MREHSGDGMPLSFNVSSLAHVSEGYSTGSILSAIDNTLTARRLANVERAPIEMDEFFEYLSTQELVYTDDHEKFMSFHRSITGLGSRISSAKSGEDGGGEKKGKKGKKKGKKK